MPRGVKRRLERLESATAREGYAAAIERLSDGDLDVLVGYAERALAADEAGHARPHPTPEQQEAFGRFAELRQRALREGWGDSAYRIC